MEDCVILEEMIFTCISRHLKLASDSDRAIQPFTLLNALVDLPVVVFEVERVVVKTAESYLDV
jgi:hypothetical protein